MKITENPYYSATSPASKTLRPTSASDLKPTRKKTRNPSLSRVRKPGAPGRRSRPETPLLKWKVEDKERNRKVEVEEEEVNEDGRRSRWKHRKAAAVVSARKLAAGLWRLQGSENGSGGRGQCLDRLGFQPGAGHADVPFHVRRSGKAYGSEPKDPLQSPSSSVTGIKNGFLCKLEPSFPVLQFCNGGATKWDPLVVALEAELEQVRTCMQELETERRFSTKKKLEHFLRKASEEKAAWRSREHEKIRVFIDDLKGICRTYEKERKARELIEEVCDELAKEIGEDKSEVEALKRDSMKLREEAEDERKMLQMAEMNKLVADLETFLRSRSATPDVKELKEAEILRQAAASMNIQEIKEFTYEPPNPDDIFSVFEDVNFGEPNEREIEQCGAYSPVSHSSKVHTVSPEVNVVNRDSIHRHSNAYVGQNIEMEEDDSGWETVSHLDDQGSSCSPEGSELSIKNRRCSNVSGSGMEWDDNGYEGTPITEIGEVCSGPTKKKVSSIARLWRSGPNNGENCKIITVEGMKGRLSNGRLSNGSIASPDRGSGKGGLSPPDLTGQWSSPDSGNPHITRGMKGCIEWPRGAQKNSLKAKLLEARIESQKLQLRQEPYLSRVEAAQEVPGELVNKYTR
ncbi:hypothetical protein Pint_04147 [Pistacia integerrima]|uniref:Uncharacterized protein n=1 Tax=Pistacia integerrima TaxID=434235 RepID=A0ACC0Z108_9ROSI|nr:hypothetical protein Pint_04147 [Pistacia integerrima]